MNALANAMMISLLVLAGSAPASAQSQPLTEDQLSSVTGGESIDFSKGADQDGAVVVDKVLGGDAENAAVNDGVTAVSPVNLAETKVDNSVTNDNSTNGMVLMNDTQRDAKAVNILNSVGNNAVAVGINALYVREPGQQSGSSFPGVGQSNVIIQK